MGANIAHRLLRKNIQVIGYHRSPDILDVLSKKLVLYQDNRYKRSYFINKLDSPKIIWIMLPSGQTTVDMLLDLSNKLHKGNLIIDGGNKTTVAGHKVFKK